MDLCLCVHRAGEDWGRFLSGRRVMAAASTTTVTVMATLTASSRCPSAVLQNPATSPGTRRLVPLHWPRHSAVAVVEKNK